MVTSFTSVSDDRSLSLQRLASKIQRANFPFSWNFVSGTVSDDGILSATFKTQIKNSTKEFHLHTVVTPNGESRHYSVI